MTADTEAEEPIPSWLPHAVLDAIRDDASGIDPGRAAAYAGVDAERVRRAIDRADDLLAAHLCSGDEVVDLVLARAALLVAQAMTRPLMGETHG